MFSEKRAGGVALRAGEGQVLSADAAAASETTKGAIELSEGAQQMDLIYCKAGDAAQLEFSHNGAQAASSDKSEGAIEYGKASLLPIISKISPVIGAPGSKTAI